jgi:hypothetical protein
MNSKAVTRFWLIVLLVGVSLLRNTSLYAQEPVIMETFDDPDLPGWDHAPNVYTVDGVLRVEPGGFAGLSGPWDAFEMTLLARWSGAGEMAIIAHASDAGSMILLYSGERCAGRAAGGCATPWRCRL